MATLSKLCCQYRRGYMRCMQRSKKLDPISIRLEPDLKAALEGLAKDDDRSLSAYINRALRQHVENLSRKRPRGKSESKI
jgi:hypothetical protein